MSSRALRKAQKEREEAALQKRLAERNDESEEEEEEEELPTVKARPSAFALLGEANEDSDHDNNDDGDSTSHQNEEEDERVGPEDASANAAENESDEPRDTPATQSKRNKNKKKNKKKKKKQQQQQSSDDDKGQSKSIAGEDEIDAAIADLANASVKERKGTADLDPDVQEELEASKLLGTHTQNLQVLNEVRRAFGKDFVEGDLQDRNDFMTAVRRRAMARTEIGLADLVTGLHSMAGEGLSEALIRRNIFVRGRKEWPKATATGLSMEVVKRHPSGITEYAFVHNAMYRAVSNEFLTSAYMGDPMALVNLLRQHPYHITTLLQVATYAKVQGDGAVAGELLERALFSFGRALHTSFAEAIGEGRARLDFRRPENREFFLAARRYLLNLSQRGTRRTEYEWAKLLLSLSPVADPSCMRLCLDRLALGSQQQKSFLAISSTPFFQKRWACMPNVKYSRALAQLSSSPDEAKTSLESAIATFPHVLNKICEPLGLQIPKWATTKTSVAHDVLATTYASESLELFKSDEAKALLRNALTSTPPSQTTTYEQEDPSDQDLRNMARYAIISENRTVLAALPEKAKLNIGDEFDPLPPHDTFPLYAHSETARPNRRPVAGHLHVFNEGDTHNDDDRQYQEFAVTQSDPVVRYYEIPANYLRRQLPRCFIAELARLQDWLTRLVPNDVDMATFRDAFGVRSDWNQANIPAQTFPSELVAQILPGAFPADQETYTIEMAARIPALLIKETWTRDWVQAQRDSATAHTQIEHRFSRFRELLNELNSAPSRTVIDVLGSSARLVPGRNLAIIQWFDARVEGEDPNVTQVNTEGTLSAVLGQCVDDFEDVNGEAWFARWGVEIQSDDELETA